MALRRSRRQTSNSVTALDIAVLATVWLPWESWIPRWVKQGRLSKWVVGLYLLYCAFGAWHFRSPPWMVVLPAALGTVVCGLALKERADGRKARASLGRVASDSAARTNLSMSTLGRRPRDVRRAPNSLLGASGHVWPGGGRFALSRRCLSLGR